MFWTLVKFGGMKEKRVITYFPNFRAPRLGKLIIWGIISLFIMCGLNVGNYREIFEILKGFEILGEKTHVLLFFGKLCCNKILLGDSIRFCPGLL